MAGKPLEINNEGTSTLSEDVNLENVPRTIKWGPLESKSSPTATVWPAAEWWTNQMTLDPDGIRVKEDEFNDPVEGIEAIWKIIPDSEGDFQDGKDTRYFAALIERLRNEGYSDTTEGNVQANLIAAPYDWRLSAFGLETKYQYFTNLKTQIKNLHDAHNKPVVIIAHSMGNRVTQYFLQWVKKHDPVAGEEWGQSWIDKYVARYIAVSPPWLRAPLSIRFLVSNDPITLSETFALSEIKSVIQSLSSVPWLLPIKAAPDEFFNTKDFAFLLQKNSAPSTSNTVNPKTIEEILELEKPESITLEYINGTHYALDPHIGKVLEPGNKLLERPPVNRLDVIYATGHSTVVGAYYYQTNGTLKVTNQYGPLDSEGEPNPVPDFQDPKFYVSQGLRLETVLTEQKIDNGTPNSGDGVVPYVSLAYHKYWIKQHLDQQTNDYPISLPDKNSAGHENILKVDPGISRIINSVLDYK